ncbi:putative amp-binding enzyme [Diaporthe ampelina]|uniref:Putative amp-binding enzyme n=1 Tax=Diaporthe ampelina TaxID=1214573 RepID=A0A0G2FCV1_9PEZI|nr:putative amp-binding enzyme [Diaporthe ampelina]
MPHPQDHLHASSLRDPESFWAEQARHLHWHKKPSTVLRRYAKTLPKSHKTHDHWEWFPDGEISTCYNCVDRHVEAGNGDSPAILYDSPVTQGTRQRITYAELLGEVEALAAVLRGEGVGRGDTVLVYMPMIPAALVGLLAVSRLGAVHAVVFGGFAPNALAQRIDASRPRAILTASCGIDGNKPPVPYRDYIVEAERLAGWKTPRTIVWQREQLAWHPLDKGRGERNWNRLVRSAKLRGHRVKECVPVKGTDGVYTLYGPLLVGAATVLYEGKPVGTPDPSSFWRMIEEYKVNAMFTAPTALRAIRKDDPQNKHITKIGERGGLRTLRAMFLAGERSEPAIITMYQDLLGKYGDDKVGGGKVIDNWWSSESGSPMTGVSMTPHVVNKLEARPPLPIRPGSAGKPMPGFDIRVVDDEGNELGKGKMGNIVLNTPLAPTAFRTLWEDEERFYGGYLKRFDGKWLDTGDAGIVDQDGYVHIMARSDDIINVAAHRLSTGTLEQAITSHPQVTEACVVGIPDSMKGQLPFAFVLSSSTSNLDDTQLLSEIQKLVRTQVGPIASLGGMIRTTTTAKPIIPKTRSGKTLRRVLRELLENAVHGDFDKNVGVPSTVEDAGVVDTAKGAIRHYFEKKGEAHRAIEERPKL